MEAEAAFLGAVLINNTVAETGVPLEPNHFFEPVHSRIFARILALVAKGQTVTPVTLRPHFEADESLKELGGLGYLARLTSDGQGLLAPREIAEQIVELANQRAFDTALQDAMQANGQHDADVLAIADGIAAAARRCAGRDADPFEALDLAQLAERKPEPKVFAIEQLAPMGEVTLLTGAGSAGKSLAGQQMATAAAAGMKFLGLQVINAPAIYLTCEDDADQVHWRQAHLCNAMEISMSGLAGRLHLVSRRGALENELATFATDGSMIVGPAYRRLASMIKTTSAKLVVLDNLAHLFIGNENDRSEVTRFVNLLNRLAGETGAAIILIGHPNKAGDSYSGTTAWLNSVRSQMTITHDVETDVRTLAVGKANYARKGDAVTFIWRDWAFVKEDDLPADEVREHRETVQASSDNILFLTCLRERIKQQRAVSERRGPTFAPTEFAKMVESKSIGKERLEQAMDRLFRTAQIERAELWISADRKPVVGLRETAGNAGNGPDLFAGNTVRATRATVLETAENRAVNGAGNGQNEFAHNGAVNTVRSTRGTVPKPAEILAGNAANTHSPLSSIEVRGGALEGPPLPTETDEGAHP